MSLLPSFSVCDEYEAIVTAEEPSEKQLNGKTPYVSCAMSVNNQKPSPSSPSKHITVVDVYDLAASIGKDFEKMIEIHGNDCVMGIMPKVISALETLEAMASHQEREKEEIYSLQRTVETLEKEKKEKLADKIKFEEELEAVEDNYKKEIAELREMVRSLMHENKNLSCTVSSLPAPLDSPMTTSMREEDMKVMLDLREMSQQQKEEIHQLQSDVNSYSCEVENLTNSVEKLIHQNEELLRKNASLQKQGRMIVEEKIDIIRRLEKAEETNMQLRRLLHDADLTCKDLQQQNACDDEPRFTLAELREVLQEKNVLKGRVMELEEELELLKPGSTRNKAVDYDEPEPEEPRPSTAEDVDDLPVYGPMPREPEEKLYPWKYERNNSGVRKLFRINIFGTSSRRSTAPSTSTSSPFTSHVGRSDCQRDQNSQSPSAINRLNRSFRFFKDLGVSSGAMSESSPGASPRQGGSPRAVRSVQGLAAGPH